MEKPNKTEILLLSAIFFVGILGIFLFSTAMGMPSTEGPWLTITAIMVWISAMCILMVNVELEKLRREIREKRGRR